MTTSIGINTIDIKIGKNDFMSGPKPFNDKNLVLNEPSFRQITYIKVKKQDI